MYIYEWRLKLKSFDVGCCVAGSLPKKAHNMKDRNRKCSSLGILLNALESLYKVCMSASKTMKAYLFIFPCSPFTSKLDYCNVYPLESFPCCYKIFNEDFVRWVMQIWLKSESKKFRAEYARFSVKQANDVVWVGKINNNLKFYMNKEFASWLH